MRRAIFLDRDGVLNRAIVREGKPYSPANLGELEIFPDAPKACEQLGQAGFLRIVITNQPEVARGTLSRETVEAIHQALRAALSIDDIRACFHDDATSCACRKPRPGLLLDAAQDWGINLQQSFLVGDRWKDIEAGHLAGCASLFIDHGYAELQPSNAEACFTSLGAATHWILQRMTSEEEVTR